MELSPTGDNLYITNSTQQKLFTLVRDGSVVATLDPELQYTTGAHVTPSGQVLVCGQASKIILQVDSKGSKKPANLGGPWSVCYNSNTDSIIVGRVNNNKILLYQVQ
ncbi:hypothetical protein DPMN_079189 [Dreissena polymorpha]|uniref:Uncharacterized protein n=1 Tax=Dreissena polymorpha TaxID=45954 RepID=A0A9D4BPU3_DREPO|nr:hypothetical protein DPMN_079189 [Dreissena polymorpha]